MQLNIKHPQSSAYHPQNQGALEMFHLILKSLLHAYCTELDCVWVEGLIMASVRCQGGFMKESRL